MNILGVTYFLNGFLMIAMPIGLAVSLTRRFNLGWRLFWIGMGTFVFSQVLHIPFNALVNPVFTQFGFIALPTVLQNVVLSLFLGLSAGLFEEISRYAMYRWWAKDARSWGRGLLVGVGHGGTEAIILGVLVLYGYLQMLIVRGVDVSTLVTPDKVELAKAQIQAYWSAPWYLTMLGALERLFAIPLHLACSVLVLQAFTRKKIWWLGLAVLLHALADGAAVFASQSGLPALAIEGIVGVYAVVSVGIVFMLRQPEPRTDLEPAPISTLDFKPAPVEETEDEKLRKELDDSKYQDY